MVSAYTAFANKGIRVAPLFVTRIEDSDGNVLSTFAPQMEEVISISSAYKMLVMLRAVINEGTGGRVRRYGITADMGGKTGTTNDNSDAWFMGFTPSLVEVNSEQQPSVVEEKYKTNRLTEEECKELHKKLVAYVEKEKPYINPDLKMGDLASALDTSSHSLSYLLNQYLNQSYYDFINEYRVTQFKKMVADSQYSRYTLTALAELCGFSSRASFFRSFKKSTGVTPNEYIRSIGGTAKEE